MFCQNVVLSVLDSKVYSAGRKIIIFLHFYNLVGDGIPITSAICAGLTLVTNTLTFTKTGHTTLCETIGCIPIL